MEEALPQGGGILIPGGFRGQVWTASIDCTPLRVLDKFSAIGGQGFPSMTTESYLTPAIPKCFQEQGRKKGSRDHCKLYVSPAHPQEKGPSADECSQQGSLGLAALTRAVLLFMNTVGS